jgi:hypothetical protein
METLPIPDSLPTTDQLLVDDAGYLWAHNFRPPGARDSRWSVFSKESRWIGDVVFDGNFTPTQITTTHIAGILVDDDGREFGAVYEIMR